MMEELKKIMPQCRPNLMSLEIITVVRGVYCYDEDIYLGVILDVEEHDIKVKCMHRMASTSFTGLSVSSITGQLGDSC